METAAGSPEVVAQEASRPTLLVVEDDPVIAGAVCAQMESWRSFLLGFLPVYAGVLTMGGEAAAGSAASGTLLTALCFLAQLAAAFVQPLLHCYLMLSMACCISAEPALGVFCKGVGRKRGYGPGNVQRLGDRLRKHVVGGETSYVRTPASAEDGGVGHPAPRLYGEMGERRRKASCEAGCHIRYENPRQEVSDRVLFLRVAELTLYQSPESLLEIVRLNIGPRFRG